MRSFHARALSNAAIPVVFLTALTGCSQIIRTTGSFSVKQPDASISISFGGEFRYPAKSGTGLLRGHIEDCDITSSTDGHSLLTFSGGELDLTAYDANGHPHFTANGLFTAPDDFTVAALLMPVIVSQPLLALPDRLTWRLEQAQPAPGPVRNLAQALVDYKGVAVAGSVGTGGVFAATITLTNTGRAAMVNALNAQDATTRPSTRPAPSATSETAHFH